MPASPSFSCGEFRMGRTSPRRIIPLPINRFSDVFINVRCFLFCKVELALMETVTVSSKGQVTIPSRLRKELNIVKGEKLLIVREGNLIKMIPVLRLSNLAAWIKKYSRRKTFHRN
jgi:AbrB family looped-hinge helix DNA binding protein